MKYLESYEKLNDMQKKAADAVEGPKLVLAGAGSGKTATMTVRLAKLIKEQNVSPHHIYCSTFTNKAAKEMRDRLEDMLGADAIEGIWMGTFHSMCVRMLRRDGHHLGFDQNEYGYTQFTIYDTDDQDKVLSSILRNRQLDGKVSVKSAMSYIDTCKNNLWDPDYASENYAESYQEEVLSIVYRDYQKQLKKNNAMDFGDLIYQTVILLRDNEEVRNYWQTKFRFVLTDEFQDSNYAQLQLLLFLSAPHYNLFVIGDDSQAIYGFRGSDIGIILSFEKMFPHAEVINLGINYRSTDTIVRAGSAIISNNREQLEKSIVSFKGGEAPIVKVSLNNELQEANFIASLIRSEVDKEKRDYKDFAVLYRNNFHSRVIEEKLVEKGIPYIVVGGHSFFSREEIKDVFAYLRLVFNEKDNIAALRMINKPKRGIGEKTVKAIEDFAKLQKLSIFEAVKQMEFITQLTTRHKNGLKSFIKLVDDAKEMIQKEDVQFGDMMREFIHLSKIKDHYENHERRDEKLENLNELVQLFKDAQEREPEKSLEEHLQELSLLSSAEEESSPNVVQLMTIHASKGLEFPVCIAPGWNENVFPSSRSIENNDVGEERRVAYVAITRAEEELFITTTKQRKDFTGKSNYSKPSRFLEEIPEKLSIEVDLSTK